MDGWPISALTPLGALCLVLALPYLQMARGKLVPRSTVNEMIRDHEREMETVAHDRDEWRAESRIRDQQLSLKDEQLAEKDRQLRHLGEVGRTMEAVLTTMQRLLAARREVEP